MKPLKKRRVKPLVSREKSMESVVDPWLDPTRR